MRRDVWLLVGCLYFVIVGDAQAVEPPATPRDVAIVGQVIRALHDGGVGILLGSDAPQVYNVPGFAAYRELQLMVASGLTPYEALRTATAAPAEFFGATGAYGTIVVGADAGLDTARGRPAAGYRQHAEHRGRDGARSLARPRLSGPRPAGNRKTHGKSVKTA